MAGNCEITTSLFLCESLKREELEDVVPETLGLLAEERRADERRKLNRGLELFLRVLLVVLVAGVAVVVELVLLCTSLAKSVELEEICWRVAPT